MHVGHGRDRVRLLRVVHDDGVQRRHRLMAHQGAVDLQSLNQEVAPDALALHQADRDAFVAHVLSPLLGKASSLGVQP